MPNQFKKQFNRLKKERTLFIALIFVLITIIVWTFVSILSTYGRRREVDLDVQKLAEPLTPHLDAELFENLDKKRYLDTQELERFPIYVILEDDRRSGPIIVNVVDNQIVMSTQEEEEDELGDEDEVEETGFSDILDDAPDSQPSEEEADDASPRPRL